MSPLSERSQTGMDQLERFNSTDRSAKVFCTRFLEWIPEVPDDVSWLFGVAGDVYRQVWRGFPAGSLR